jgi:hypothetical protein
MNGIGVATIGIGKRGVSSEIDFDTIEVTQDGYRQDRLIK